MTADGTRALAERLRHPRYEVLPLEGIEAAVVAHVQGGDRDCDRVAAPGARPHADGLLSFVGRTRDMIKRAGENVAAGEVEAVLLDHPGVRDAAVVGVPDAMRDEQIVAFVVPVQAAGLDAGPLKAWCTQRLASFRVPSQILLQHELPRTAVERSRSITSRPPGSRGQRMRRVSV